MSVNKFYLKYYRYIPGCRTVSIYNGVDFSFKQDKRMLFSKKNSIELLYVGRLDEQKDL